MKKIGTLLLLAVLLSLMCASAVAAVTLDVSGNNYYDIYPTGYKKNGGTLKPVLGSNDYILKGTWNNANRAAITFHSLTPMGFWVGDQTYNVVFDNLKITGGKNGAISFGNSDQKRTNAMITLNVTDYSGTNELNAKGSAAFVYSGKNRLEVNILHKHSMATLNVSNETTNTNQPIVISGNNATVNANGIQYTAGSDANKTTPTMEAVTLSNRADQLNKTNEKPATCEDEGNIAYWSCTVAGCRVICSDEAGTRPISKPETVIPPAGHKPQYVARNEATCTTDGNKEYWECTACNKKFSDAQAKNEISDEALKILAHDGLTHYAAVEADCTTDGNKEYWECNTCNKKYSDAQATTVITDVVIPSGHDLEFVPEVPSTCKDEGVAAHYACKRPSCQKLFSNADGKGEISIDELKLPLSANHDIKPVDATPATCNDPGLDAHFECSICGLKYKDASGTTPITEEDIVAPPLGHHFDPAWHFDDEGHWHMCRQPLPQRTRSTNHICGELSQKEPHTFAWVVDKESTTDAAGQRHEECTVCGYEGGMEELPKIDLPATGDSSHLMRWAALLGVCCAGLAGMARRKRR